ncbi:MAG: [citrate (pro-3S)-lyase] ligase [Fusobacteria bacterium]|nr:[citrate (pro-3S)-lyase] ligase [Fusobacteriota bacterium]
MFEIKIAYDFDKIERNNAKAFLNHFELEYEEGIDTTINLYINSELVGTGSKEKDVFKCFAIAKSIQGSGALSKLLSILQSECNQNSIFHFFLFSKIENLDVFEKTLFQEVAHTERVVLFEGGIGRIESILKALASKLELNSHVKRSAIVMNCNPFTKGHRYLIETASQESEEVIVFVLEEDLSLFDTQSRFEMVKLGVEDLKNVKVILSGEYIISSKTFPTYFLKKNDDMTQVYTNLDVTIFGKYFCEILGIDKRYIGTEPNCNITECYNLSIQNLLPQFGVEVKVLKRIESAEGVISASKVREYIKKSEYEKLSDMLPESTIKFLQSEKGRRCVEKIQKNSKS